MGRRWGPSRAPIEPTSGFDGGGSICRRICDCGPWCWNDWRRDRVGGGSIPSRTDTDTVTGGDGPTYDDDVVACGRGGPISMSFVGGGAAASVLSTTGRQ